MPKLINPTLEKQNRIRGWIKYGKTMRGLKHDELARRLGMSPTTLSYRITHPETIRLDEFWRMEKVLGKYQEF